MPWHPIDTQITNTFSIVVVTLHTDCCLPLLFFVASLVLIFCNLFFTYYSYFFSYVFLVSSMCSLTAWLMVYYKKQIANWCVVCIKCIFAIFLFLYDFVSGFWAILFLFLHLVFCRIAINVVASFLLYVLHI